MNRPTTRSVVLLALSLVILAMIGSLAYNRIKNRKVSTQPVSQYAVSEIPAETLPSRFPGDLPIPADANVTKNEALNAPDGRSQETRAYLSARGIGEEKAAYDAYFEGEGWDLQDAKEIGGRYAAFLAVRGDLSMQVSMNAQGSGTAVTIIATAAPASIVQ